MKKIFSKNILIGGGLLQLLLLSCNDKLPELGIAGKLYLPQADKFANVLFYSKEDVAQAARFGVSIGGSAFPSRDITVSYQILPGEVDNYNRANNTNYERLPESTYSMESLTGVIKAGKSNSTLNTISITPQFLTAGVEYLLPVSFHTASGMQINEQMQIHYITVKFEEPIPDGPIDKFDRTGWEVVDFSSNETFDPSEWGYKYVFDGNTLTTWASAHVLSPAPPPPHYITIDMKEVKILHGVYYSNRNFGDWDGYRATDIIVYVSNDGNQWTQQQRFSNIPKPEGPIASPETISLLQFDERVQARYFKLEMHTSNFGTTILMSEIGAIGVIVD